MPEPIGDSPRTLPTDSSTGAGDTWKIDASFDTVWDGKDTLGVTEKTTLLHFAPKTTYDAPLQNPELPMPDSEGQSGPQPYGMAEQKLIKQAISQQVIQRLKASNLSPDQQQALYKAILEGKKPQDPALAQLAKSITDDVTKSVRDDAHLPASWTLTSTTAKDWIPLPIAPYDAAKQKEIGAFYDTSFTAALTSYAAQTKPPLTEAQIGQLTTAKATGQVPSSIANDFNAVSKQAAAAVQQQYGLPATWFNGTTDVDNLKPVNVGIVTPAAVNRARGELLLENIDTLSSNFADAGKRVLDGLPPNSPAAAVLRDYMAVISTAINELKAVLRQTEVSDALKSREATRAQFDATQLKLDDAQDQIAKQKEAQEKQAKANRVSLAMKIIGPIIAAISTIVGAVLAIFTFGASTALIVAGIAVGIALTTYSIVDSATGCTSSLVETINEALAEAYPDNEVVQKLIKAAILVAVVAVLVIAVVATGGGAGGNIGAQTAAQVAKQAVLETVKQLSIQVILMAVMSSNAIPELLGAILKANGVDEKTCQGLQIAMMVLTMVVAMVAVAKAGGSAASSAEKTATTQSTTVVQSAKNIGNQIITNVEKMIEAIKTGAKEGVQELVRVIKELLKKLQEMLKNVPNAIQGAADELSTAATNLANKIGNVTMKEIQEALISFKNALKEFASNALTKAIDKSIEVLRQAGGKAKETAEEIAAGFKSMFDGYKKIPDLIKAVSDMKTLKAAISKGKDVAENLVLLQTAKDNVATLGADVTRTTSKTLMLTSEAIGVAEGITLGVIGLQLYKIQQELGETQESQELMQAIINTLNKLLENLGTGMKRNAALVDDMTTALDQLVARHKHMDQQIFGSQTA